MNRISLKTNQSHPAIKAYKNAVERGMKSHHVVPKGDMWAVQRAGASRASAIFSTQSEAIMSAKTLAKSHNSELFIHGSDGRIRERISCG